MLRQRFFKCLLIWSACLLSASAMRAADQPPPELLQHIVKLLGDSDREFRAAGLDLVRTGAKGTAATELFASQLKKLDGESQIALLKALADRRDPAARPAVLEIASASKDSSAQAAAIAALGQLGNASDIPLLIKSILAGGAAEQAARQSLVTLSGDTVSKTIASELRSNPAQVKSQLIDVLAIRRARGEIDAIVDSTTDDNAQVRIAAMNALGQLGRPDQLMRMLPGVLKAQPGGERDNAERNVTLVCSRINNEDERGTRLIQALNSIEAPDRDKLLSLVGRVGGRKLIDFVGEIATGPNTARRRLGIDALSKWPDATVADKLLEIAVNATDPAERNQAFQGYVKISATRDNRNDKQRLERMKQAMKVAKTPDEQSLVINRTRTAYDVESLRFVLPYVDQPQFAQIACETIVEIAHHREVRDPNKAEFDKALDKVITTAKDPVVIDRAQRYKRGETWERPRK